jgi:hypothetical protein
MREGSSTERQSLIGTAKVFTVDGGGPTLHKVPTDVRRRSQVKQVNEVAREGVLTSARLRRR